MGNSGGGGTDDVDMKGTSLKQQEWELSRMGNSSRGRNFRRKGNNSTSFKKVDKTNKGTSGRKNTRGKQSNGTFGKRKTKGNANRKRK